MWKFIVDVVHDFVSSIQPDVGRGFLHVSNVFLFLLGYQPLVGSQRDVAARQCRFEIGAFLRLDELASRVDKPHLPTMLKVLFDGIVHRELVWVPE